MQNNRLHHILQGCQKELDSKNKGHLQILTCVWLKYAKK